MYDIIQSWQHARLTHFCFLFFCFWRVGGGTIHEWDYPRVGLSKGGIIHGVLAWRAKGGLSVREDYTWESMADYYKVHRRCQNHMHFKETLLLLMLCMPSNRQQPLSVPSDWNLCFSLYKVILATNIAESSITVPDIKYGKLLHNTVFYFLHVAIISPI